MKDSIYGMKFKTVSWLPEDGVLFVTNGVEAMTHLDGTNKEAHWQVKKPNWVYYHKGRVLTAEQLENIVGTAE